VALASPSADTILSADPLCQDLDVMRFAAGDPWARMWLPEGAWQALLGDVDANGLADAPAGIDALSWYSASSTAPRRVTDLLFSSDADFLGWKDGDILRLNSAGDLEILYSEDHIRLALGATGALDVDALERRDDGLIWFSLRDALSSSAFGPIEDGDILIYEPGSGTAWRHATELQVQAWVDQAMPGAGDFGDLKSLAFHPLTGELLFTVQSPSAADASVFSAAGGGSLLPDFEEARWGFLQSTELDALTFSVGAPSQAPVITAEVSIATQNQTFGLTVRHAAPNASLFGLVGASRKLIPTRRGGFGYVAFDPSGPTRTWPAAQAGHMSADANGTVITSFTAPQLPPGHPGLDLIFQAWDINAAQLSTPVLVSVL
jgi:hypothetical protein